MFRLSFNLLAKRTTGFTCFPVVENPKPVLLSLYDQTLEQLAKFPAHVRSAKSHFVDVSTCFTKALVCVQFISVRIPCQH
jgi:hypothetical protein